MRGRRSLERLKQHYQQHYQQHQQHQQHHAHKHCEREGERGEEEEEAGKEEAPLRKNSGWDQDIWELKSGKSLILSIIFNVFYLVFSALPVRLQIQAISLLQLDWSELKPTKCILVCTM